MPARRKQGDEATRKNKRMSESPKGSKAKKQKNSGDNVEQKVKIYTRITSNGRKVDSCCWICHKPGDEIICLLCPRVYHRQCLKSTSNELSSELDPCPECLAKSVNGTEFPVNITELELQGTLKYIKIKTYPLCEGVLQRWPMHVYPVCFSVDDEKLVEFIKRGRYKNTAQFYGDVKWIYHNCYHVLGANDKTTTFAYKIMKDFKNELLHLELCYECYTKETNAELDDVNTFVTLCENPHRLLWVKLKGYPYWPSKCLKVINGMAHVQFFGTHDRTAVKAKTCFLMSENTPSGKSMQRPAYQNAVDEMMEYIKNYEEKYGPYQYAAAKTIFVPSDTENCVVKRGLQLSCSFNASVSNEVENENSDSDESNHDSSQDIEIIDDVEIAESENNTLYANCDIIDITDEDELFNAENGINNSGINNGVNGINNSENGDCENEGTSSNSTSCDEVQEQQECQPSSSSSTICDILDATDENEPLSAENGITSGNNEINNSENGNTENQEMCNIIETTDENEPFSAENGVNNGNNEINNSENGIFENQGDGTSTASTQDGVPLIQGNLPSLSLDIPSPILQNSSTIDDEPSTSGINSSSSPQDESQPDSPSEVRGEFLSGLPSAENNQDIEEVEICFVNQRPRTNNLTRTDLSALSHPLVQSLVSEGEENLKDLKTKFPQHVGQFGHLPQLVQKLLVGVTQLDAQLKEKQDELKEFQKMCNNPFDTKKFTTSLSKKNKQLLNDAIKKDTTRSERTISQVFHTMCLNRERHKALRDDACSKNEKKFVDHGTNTDETCEMSEHTAESLDLEREEILREEKQKFEADVLYAKANTFCNHCLQLATIHCCIKANYCDENCRQQALPKHAPLCENRRKKL